jgi:hypothetical protein
LTLLPYFLIFVVAASTLSLWPATEEMATPAAARGQNGEASRVVGSAWDGASQAGLTRVQCHPLHHGSFNIWYRMVTGQHILCWRDELILQCCEFGTYFQIKHYTCLNSSF